ncbi:bridge-like lipid transfer protein family member 3B [Paramacrobiotus metropolitanus]|uniref:bridge-like lipid transfer protein family member 3B n=1 Tax=Paramacrobiotus metropolitanus TaxID=2943436 RepID=UPI0024463432|nr:bridge-like lipid transfer protein family member 3B [Paramacrobiotus metropolitanus]XP_055331731.1 bridge-like lipid transfer protein family member 3B [Paramacrobiotus metropolitanus]
MATGIIKKQLLKVLSRFTKNVDPDKVQFSSLSQASLSDLVLNETVLTDILDFPVWMKISRVVCNRVTIQIPWTNLSSQPIRIALDEVYVDMETCKEFRKPSDAPTVATSGYGRTEMAMDGMLITVNMIEMHFRAPSFHMSFQINRVKCFSTTSNYDGTNDLRMTRIKDEAKDAIMVFKCIAWQTLRVEASSGPETQGLNSSSIRFITNGGQARIALKKSLSSCALLASRLQIIMDDLLWVLTPTQLKAALLVLEQIKDLAKQAELQERDKKAAKKLDSSLDFNRNSKKVPINPNTPAGKMSQYFDKIDIRETSYHFHLGKLNMHICDEPQRSDAAPPRKYDDAAILVELTMLKVDHYPFHIPSIARRHWLTYQEPTVQYLDWQKDILGDYVRKIELSVPELPVNPFKIMMNACWVFRLEDFRINNMTTFQSQKSRENDIINLFPFCCSTKKLLHLPKQCAALHAEYIVHYFPQAMPCPPPPHIMSVYCNPLQVTLDPSTLDWFSLICSELIFKDLSPGTKLSADMVPDVACRFETLLPKIISPGSPLHASHPFTKCLQLQSGRVIMTNTDIGRTRSLSDSLSSIDKYNSGLVDDRSFPNYNGDPDVCLFLDLAKNLAQNPPLPYSVWSATTDPMWIEFIDLKSPKLRPIPFLDAIPVTVWMIPLLFASDQITPTAVLMLVDIFTPIIKAQTTAEGYNTIMHCNETAMKVSESIVKMLARDTVATESSALVFQSVAILPKIEFTLLLGASQSPSESLDRISGDGPIQEKTPEPLPAVAQTADKAFDLGSFGENDMGQNLGSSENLFLKDGDFDARSMHSVVSEASIADMSSFTFDDHLLIPSDSEVSAPVIPDNSALSRGNLDLISPTNRAVVHLLVVEIEKSELTLANWKEFFVTKLRLLRIGTKESGDMDLEGANERFYSKNSAEEEMSLDTPPTVSSSVVGRFQIEQLPNGEVEREATVHCQDLSFSISSDAASQIGSFFVTDVVGDPLPLLLRLQNFTVALTEKIPRDVPSPPFTLKIPLLFCQRSQDGIFVVEPTKIDNNDQAKENGVVNESTSSIQGRLFRLEKERKAIEEEIKSVEILLQQNQESK